jgi:hypothetical protein
MSNQPLPALVNSVRSLDSLVANEFVLELDGEPVTGVFSVSGLVSFKLNPQQPALVNEPFRIAKMLQRDPHTKFNAWLRETIAAPADSARPRRTLTVLAVDNAIVIRRWTAKGAWIGEVRYSDFNTASGELVEETVTVYYDSLETEWTLLEAGS